MKKVLSAVLIFFIVTGVLSGCGNNIQSKGEDKINIVCTTFAAYDWTREIVGTNSDRFFVTLLGDGVDIHSFQPTAADITKIHTADLFVQMGGTTEEWAKSLNLGNKTLKLFDLFDDTEKLCIKNPHMQLKLSENNYDEHIWLSLRRAQRMVTEICKRICDLDTARGVQYQKNCAEYIKGLKSLDKEYQLEAEASGDKVVIFADRYPFVYMMYDYEINCISAFDGCSADSNASFETIAHLVEDVKKYGKDTVLVLENSAESVAEPLRDALTDRELKVEIMNSCQTISETDDTSYMDIMTQNLKSLKKALR